MKTAILIQARTGSKRFPGKVLTDLDGRALIEHVYWKCREAHNNVVFVVPGHDLELMKALEMLELPYFYGDENDVLSRFLDCAIIRGIENIVRITADCPLLNPANITHSLHLQKRSETDFVSNCIHPCVDGQEVEIITRKVLKWLDKHAEGEHREHVTTYLKDNLPQFSSAGFKWLAWSDPYPVKWAPKLSVDTPEDLQRIQTILDLKKGES